MRLILSLTLAIPALVPQGAGADDRPVPPLLRVAEHTQDDPFDPDLLTIEGDAEYGAFLSGECKTCHLNAGGDTAIPSISQWPEEDFVIAMHAYKNKLRPHPIMQMMAGRLSDEEIAALAAYFATLEEE